MYLPEYTDGTEVLCKELIHESPLGLLISPTAADCTTSYLPFALQEENQKLTLLTHFARANPQWKSLQGKNILVSFQAANCYISPSVFANAIPNIEPRVPTWNYAIVQVHGVADVITNPEACKKLLLKLTSYFESRNGTAWKMKLPEAALAEMLDAIVGVEIAITSMKGKFKLSQNRSVADRKLIMANLQRSERAEDNGVLDWMRKTGWT